MIHVSDDKLDDAARLAELDANEPGHGVASATYASLLITQMLGAINDNVFRWLAVGIGKDFVKRSELPFVSDALVLSVGLGCFVLPYLLFAAPAGYLADRFSKRTVIISCKAAEIAIMLLGILAIWIGNLYLLFAIVAMMGTQSALFGPAKLGSIPEMLKSQSISLANGILGLTTVIATVVGAIGGNMLHYYTQPAGENHLWVALVVLVGVAALGLLSSFGIMRLPAANPNMKFPYNAPVQTWRDMMIMCRDRAMLRVALGIAFFWTLGSLCQLNIDQFALEGMHELQPYFNQTYIIPLMVSLIVGVGLGSVLAGVWSGGHVELGILPLGAFGIALSSIMLFTLDESLVAERLVVTGTQVTEELHGTDERLWACFWLAMLGISAGLFDVPLAAYMQHRSPREHRGAILAASNFLTFAGILASAVVYYLLRVPIEDAAGVKEPLFTARQIFLLAGLATVPVFIYIIWLIPQSSIRFVAWLLSHTAWRVRVHGQENLPKSGGALLVANHVSWLDGLFLLMGSSRLMRLIVAEPYMNKWWVRWVARTMKVITIGEGPKSIKAAIETAREALINGELVCIFAEGKITRFGGLQPFKPGMLSIVEGTGAPVVPVYLDELWRSTFSYRGSCSVCLAPAAWPYPVSIYFGEPIQHPDDIQQVRRGVETLGVEAIEQRKGKHMNLRRAFLQACRTAGKRSKIADSTGVDLTGRDLLIRTLIFRRLLLRNVLGTKEQEKYVGLLLPPTVAGAVANAALPLCDRIPVNLNYTVSSDVLNNCIRQCGIKHVLTSRKFIEKVTLDVDAEVVYLEDFKEQVTTADKLAAAFAAYCLPVGMLAWKLGISKVDPEDTLTVIFTSGSTGDPKGVVLSYTNVGSNAEAVDKIVHLKSDDVVIGILPFFHSFGFTVTLWTVLSLDIKGVYHPNPLDAKGVGSLARRHGATILLSTPTFLRAFLRRCEKEDFAKLDTVVTGAEKLPSELADAFEAKFGVRPVEGYGTTELSPFVSTNIPPSRSAGQPYEEIKEGSVGRPIPGVMAKVVNPDTFCECAEDEPGMLMIKGPNVMKGYLNKPDKTAEVIKDGWYVTGDIAKIDNRGFIEITGRQSRFSKIGGEMVPHVLVEEAINKIISDPNEEHPDNYAVVTSLPCERKGEKLIVLYTDLGVTPHDVCRRLQEAKLPNIFVPNPDNFFQVETIPVLGTGKLDLRGVQELAKEVVGRPEST